MCTRVHLVQVDRHLEQCRSVPLVQRVSLCWPADLHIRFLGPDENTIPVHWTVSGHFRLSAHAVWQSRTRTCSRPFPGRAVLLTACVLIPFSFGVIVVLVPQENGYYTVDLSPHALSGNGFYHARANMKPRSPNIKPDIRFWMNFWNLGRIRSKCCASRLRTRR
jgi:hypothetical protein